jgi:hypothetical protein
VTAKVEAEAATALLSLVASYAQDVDPTSIGVGSVRVRGRPPRIRYRECPGMLWAPKNFAEKQTSFNVT